MSERVSFCLLFCALVTAAQKNRPLEELLRVVPVSARARKLGLWLAP